MCVCFIIMFTTKHAKLYISFYLQNHYCAKLFNWNLPVYPLMFVVKNEY